MLKDKKLQNIYEKINNERTTFEGALDFKLEQLKEINDDISIHRLKIADAAVGSHFKETLKRELPSLIDIKEVLEDSCINLRNIIVEEKRKYMIRQTNRNYILGFLVSLILAILLIILVV